MQMCQVSRVIVQNVETDSADVRGQLDRILASYAEIDRRFGSDRLRLAVQREGGIEELLPVLVKESEEFRRQSEKYWIYK